MFASLILAAAISAAPAVAGPDSPPCDPAAGVVTACVAMQSPEEHAGQAVDCPGGTVGYLNADGVAVCDAAPAMDSDPAPVEPKTAPAPAPKAAPAPKPHAAPAAHVAAKPKAAPSVTLPLPDGTTVVIPASAIDNTPVDTSVTDRAEWLRGWRTDAFSTLLHARAV